MIKCINIFILQLACSFGRAVIYTLTFLSAHLQKKSFSGDNSIFRDFHVVTCCNHDRNEGVIVFSSNTLKGSIYSQATPLPSKEVFLYLKTL